MATYDHSNGPSNLSQSSYACNPFWELWGSFLKKMFDILEPKCRVRERPRYTYIDLASRWLTNCAETANDLSTLLPLRFKANYLGSNTDIHSFFLFMDMKELSLHNESDFGC